MLTSKQRAYLRAMANHLPAQYQIGKDGLNDNSLKQMDEYLLAHELLKVNVQNNLDVDVKELAGTAAAVLHAETIQQLGKRFVLYRHSRALVEKGKAIVLPR